MSMYIRTQVASVHHSAVLIVKKQKHPNCPSEKEWINNFLIHIAEYYIINNYIRTAYINGNTCKNVTLGENRKFQNNIEIQCCLEI